MKMRGLVAVGVAVLGILGSAVASTSLNTQVAENLLNQARQAAGGEAALAAVRSIRLAGSAILTNEWYGIRPGEPFINYRIDIKVMLPSRYLRTQVLLAPDGHALPAFARGFSGPTDIGGSVVANVSRVDCARLMLLVLLNTGTAIPLRLQGSVDSRGELQFDGDHGIHFALAVDPKTHAASSLRSMLRRPGPDGFPGPDAGREVAMTVAARRNVGDLTLPEQLVVRDVMTSQLLEEYRFQEIELNPPFSAATFKR